MLSESFGRDLVRCSHIVMRHSGNVAGVYRPVFRIIEDQVIQQDGVESAFGRNVRPRAQWSIISERAAMGAAAIFHILLLFVVRSQFLRTLISYHLVVTCATKIDDSWTECKVAA